MNMQQMMIQAQKMKRELEKAQKALQEKEFTINKGGAITVTMYGNKTMKSINIDSDALNPDDKDMIEDMIVMAVNELIEQIEDEEAAINERITGSASGFGI